MELQVHWLCFIIDSLKITILKEPTVHESENTDYAVMFFFIH